MEYANTSGRAFAQEIRERPRKVWERKEPRDKQGPNHTGP